MSILILSTMSVLSLPLNTINDHRFQEEIKTLQIALQNSNKKTLNSEEAMLHSMKEEDLEKERQNILNNKALIEEEKSKMLENLSAKVGVENF